MAVKWELQHNSLFEVLGESGKFVVLQQDKGLPIGGHLSAALVELVALYREYTQPWPLLLGGSLTMRYRDNFFVARRLSAAYPVDEVALKLSELLSMPVKVVESGSTMRCLEMRLSFADARRPRCVLAFRTDADRQGESGDVASWPQPDDPRTPMLLGSLLSGLAAKLQFYCHPAVAGFTATVRMTNQFVASRGYPRSWWMHAFAIALLRNGVPFPCLTRSMRKMLIAHKGIAETTHV